MGSEAASSIEFVQISGGGVGGPTNGDVTVETDEDIFEEGSDLLGKKSSEMPLKVDMGTKKRRLKGGRQQPQASS